MRRKLLRARPEAKKKISVQNKLWRRRNPEKFREKAWRYAGIKEFSVDKYNILLKSQNYSCAICKTHQSKLTRLLDVDHNHDTGIVRGLLCVNCNRGLGHFKESEDLFLEAIDYLKRNSNEK